MSTKAVSILIPLLSYLQIILMGRGGGGPIELPYWIYPLHQLNMSDQPKVSKIAQVYWSLLKMSKNDILGRPGRPASIEIFYQKNNFQGEQLF